MEDLRLILENLHARLEKTPIETPPGKLRNGHVRFAGENQLHPAAVAHDAVAAAQSRNADVVVIDTAGRLHNKSHLMQELSKIRRVIEKELPGAPHEILLVLDGTTGQNGVSQAAAFLEAVQITGIVITKLDGTAKGGVILSIMRRFDIPVKFVGVGESAEDLIPFSPQDYVETLFETA